MPNSKKINDTIKNQHITESPEEELHQDLIEESSDPFIKTQKQSKSKSKKSTTTRLISATSKVSTSLDDVWYSFSYSESREVHDDENIAEARLDLWNTVHTEVDNQVSYTIESIRGTAEPQQNVAGVPQNYGIPPEYDY